MEIVRQEGNRKVKRTIEIYNLDMILSIGYRVNSKNATRFRQWANQVLKDYLLKGYSINHRLQALELTVAEHSQKIDFFVRTALPPIEGVFYNGQIFDAYKFATDLIKSAKHSLVLIDNYVDETTLLMLSKRTKVCRLPSTPLKLVSSFNWISKSIMTNILPYSLERIRKAMTVSC